MTYSDAVSKIEDGGGTAKIQVTVGDRQAAMGDCLVTSAKEAPFVEVSEGAFQHVDNVVLLAINCNRGVATATTPGASLGSPDGRDFRPRRRKPRPPRSRNSKTYADDRGVVAPNNPRLGFAAG